MGFPITHRHAWMRGAAVTAIAATWLSASLFAGGQSAKVAQAAKPAPAAKIARTPDGQPDIRGVWAKVGGGLSEAKPPYSPLQEGGEAFGANAEPEGFSNVTTERPKIAPNVCIGPACRGTATLKPIGVVDPADRVLPWRPEADAARKDFLSKMNPAASWGHLEMNARCAPPPPFAGMPPKYSAAVQFFQRKGEVTMVFEDDHANRTIHLDGRPHLGPTFKLFMGDSIGRWEGNTLVVDTTNLNGLAQVSRSFPYFSDALHLIERFTVVDANLLDYEIIYDDPKLFTRTITAHGYMVRGFKEYEIREESCHEGSRTLRNIFGF